MGLEVVTTRYGKIKGIEKDGGAYTVFKGIPYAEPPIGENRWRPPKPPKGWDGVYQAEHFGGICPQVKDGSDFYLQECGPNEEILSEDCLYMNIWTPAQRADEKLPVILWIHGGANVTGYGHEKMFDGKGFCEQGVILVTFNWRVNIFGWLVNEELIKESERRICGNYGVLDQIAALDFVRENIAAFGGNPDNITIGGESAGSSAVMNLCSTPLARGKFKNAIMESGGGFDLFTSFGMRDMEEACRKTSLEKLLGVKTLAEARALSAEELLERIGRPEAAGEYWPLTVVDGYVFPKTIARTALDDECSKVNYLLGYNGDETHMYEPDFERNHFIKEMEEEYGPYAKDYFALCDFLEEKEKFEEYMKRRNGEILKTGAVVLADLMDSQGHPLYLYCFDRKMPGDDAGSYHAAELWYVFKTLDRNWRTFTEKDYSLSDEMAKRWAMFAKTGVPNAEGCEEWKPYTKEEPYTMVFDLESGMKNLGENQRVIFRKEFVLGQKAVRKG